MTSKNKFRTIFLLLTILTITLFESCTTANPPADTSSTTPGLTVSTVTTTSKGKYAPKNVVAIWVETSAGVYVKSLLINAGQRKSDLTKWMSISKGNTTNATTGATRNSHGLITASWNGTNTSGIIMPNGDYKVCMELTENASSGGYTSYTFTKGAAEQVQTPAAVTNFASIGIKWVPLQ
jgi:hypothetical protein